MSNIRWLSANDGPDAIPSPTQALREPNGLLAAGGSLEPDWLLASYSRGIFPWYEAGQPILWWSPDPRSTLMPEECRISKSLRKTLRQTRIKVTADTAFNEVVQACAEPRGYTNGTWITPEMAAAYSALHELGWAHSFEAWVDETLVGGLYGVAIGRVFFGESMFMRVRDASKVAFVTGIRFLTDLNFQLIDCQVPSEHLRSLGASEIRRQDFLTMLADLIGDSPHRGSWTTAFAQNSP
jgi:leucyl/phenylalanyl-tRNA--protein transferase